MNVEPVFCATLPASLAPAWGRLLEHSHRPTFQYEFDYMAAWTELLRRDWKPLILLAKEDGALRGIVPLMYRDEKRRGVLPYRRIRFLGSEMTDFSVILARPEDTAAVVHTSLTWLFKGGFRWERLILDDLAEGNPAIGAIEDFLNDNGIEFDLHVGRYYFVDLDQPWDAVWKETSKKFVRRNVNLARNRLSRSGNWRVEANPDWDAQRLVGEAARIHAARQEDLDRESLYADAPARTFVERLIGHNQTKGRFRSHWLMFEGQLIAYIFGFEERGIYYAWNMAFLPAHAHFYPSRFLWARLIRECHERKLREFNMMRGESEYKPKWTKSSRGNLRFTVRRKDHVYGRFVSFLEDRV